VPISRPAPPAPTYALTLSCSFCGKSQSEVTKLVSGPAVNICNECVELSDDIINREGEPLSTRTPVLELPVQEAENLVRRLERIPGAEALAEKAKALAKDLAEADLPGGRP